MQTYLITKTEIAEAEKLAALYAIELRGKNYTPKFCPALSGEKVFRFEFQNGVLNRAAIRFGRLADWVKLAPQNEIEIEFSETCAGAEFFHGGKVTLRAGSSVVSFKNYVASETEQKSLCEVPPIRFDDAGGTRPDFVLVKPSEVASIAASLKTQKAAKAFAKVRRAECAALQALKLATKEHCENLTVLAGGLAGALATAKKIVTARRELRAALAKPLNVIEWLGETCETSGEDSKHNLTPEHWEAVAAVYAARADVAAYKPRTKYPRWDSEKKYPETVYGPKFEALKFAAKQAESRLADFILSEFRKRVAAQGLPAEIGFSSLYFTIGAACDVRKFSRARLAARQWPARKLQVAQDYILALESRRKAQGKALAAGGAIRARAIRATGQILPALWMSADFLAGQIEKAHAQGATVEILESQNPQFPVGLIKPESGPQIAANDGNGEETPAGAIPPGFETSKNTAPAALPAASAPDTSGEDSKPASAATAGPLAALRHHVTGAIQRGEKQAIAAVECQPETKPAQPAEQNTAAKILEPEKCAHDFRMESPAAKPVCCKCGFVLKDYPGGAAANTTGEDDKPASEPESGPQIAPSAADEKPAAKISAKAAPAADLRAYFGGVAVLQPLTEAGLGWLGANCQAESWQWQGGALAIEPRLAGDILAAAQAAGLAVTVAGLDDGTPAAEPDHAPGFEASKNGGEDDKPASEMQPAAKISGEPAQCLAVVRWLPPVELGEMPLGKVVEIDKGEFPICIETAETSGEDFSENNLTGTHKSGLMNPTRPGAVSNTPAKMKIQSGVIHKINFKSGQLEPLTNPGLPVGQVITYEDRANPRREFVILGDGMRGGFTRQQAQRALCIEDGHESEVFEVGTDGHSGWQLGNRILSADELLDAISTAKANKARLQAEAEQAAKIAAEKATAQRAEWAKNFQHLQTFAQAEAAGKRASGHALGAKNIRKELARAFPGVKFSVRSDSFSGGDSIDVSWQFGPLVEDVEKITSKYSEGHFNGMEDIYEYSAGQWPQIYGGAKYVGESRSFPAEFREQVGRALCQLQRIDYGGEYTRGLMGENDDRDLGQHINELLNKATFAPGAVFAGVAEKELVSEDSATFKRLWEKYGDGFYNDYNLPKMTPEDREAWAGYKSRSGLHWCRIVFAGGNGGGDTQSAPEVPAPTNGQEQPASAPAGTPGAAAGVTVTRNQDKGGLEIRFSSKPAADVLAGLKANGWRWSRFSGCWWIKYSATAENYARGLAGMGLTEYPKEAAKIQTPASAADVVELRSGGRRTLGEIFAGTAPEFQATIQRIADVAGLGVFEVFALWREYAQQNESSDMSAIISEFVEWYAPKLGGNLAALRAAERGEDDKPASEPESGTQIAPVLADGHREETPAAATPPGFEASKNGALQPATPPDQPAEQKPAAKISAATASVGDLARLALAQSWAGVNFVQA